MDWFAPLTELLHQRYVTFTLLVATQLTPITILPKHSSMVSSSDIDYLRRCVELAREALEAGNPPFGSLLVNATGEILQEDRNRTVTEGDVTLHPELSLAKWAEKNLPLPERASATIYTSGEHCPMCAAAHAYAGLGRIVYASSSAQLGKWQKELGVKPGPVVSLPINQIVPGLSVDGPAPGLDEEVHDLHRLRQVQLEADKKP